MTSVLYRSHFISAPLIPFIIVIVYVFICFYKKFFKCLTIFVIRFIFKMSKNFLLVHYLCNFLFSTLIELHCLLLIIVCIKDLYKEILNLNVSVLYLKLLHFLIFIVSKTGSIVKCLETLYITVTKEQLKN